MRSLHHGCETILVIQVISLGSIRWLRTRQLNPAVLLLVVGSRVRRTGRLGRHPSGRIRVGRVHGWWWRVMGIIRSGSSRLRYRALSCIRIVSSRGRGAAGRGGAGSRTTARWVRVGVIDGRAVVG